MLYLGPALDHSGDIHRMLNLKTERVINSRNVSSVDKWEEQTPDTDGDTNPPTVSDDEEDLPTEPPPLLERQDGNEGDPAETDQPVEPSSRLLQEMAQLTATHNQEAESLAEQGLVKIEFVKTKDNVSDLGTKNVTKEVYDTLTPLLLSTRTKEQC
jgi:hypothetical protein